MTHHRSTRSLLRANVKKLWQAVDKRFFMIPPMLVLVLGTLDYLDIYHVSKYHLEWTALIILSFSTIGLAIRFWRNRHPYFLWAATLCGILLMREIHFSGTSDFVYIFLFGLLFLTLRHLDSLRRYLLETKISSWLATAFLIYFISVTIDQRWWRAIPWEESVHVTLEETLEVVGHLIIGISMLMVRQKPEISAGETSKVCKVLIFD